MDKTKNPFVMDEETFMNTQNLPLETSGDVPEPYLALHMARVIGMEKEELLDKKQHHMFLDEMQMGEKCDSCNTYHGVMVMNLWYRSPEHAEVVRKHLHQAAEEMAVLDRRMDDNKGMN